MLGLTSFTRINYLMQFLPMDPWTEALGVQYTKVCQASTSRIAAKSLGIFALIFMNLFVNLSQVFSTTNEDKRKKSPEALNDVPTAQSLNVVVFFLLFSPPQTHNMVLGPGHQNKIAVCF